MPIPPTTTTPSTPNNANCALEKLPITSTSLSKNDIFFLTFPYIFLSFVLYPIFFLVQYTYVSILCKAKSHIFSWKFPPKNPPIPSILYTFTIKNRNKTFLCHISLLNKSLFQSQFKSIIHQFLVLFLCDFAV